MAKRKAVGFLREEFLLSERRACRIAGLARSVAQYRPIPRNDEAATARLKELASANRRYGYKRLHALMRRDDAHPGDAKKRRSRDACLSRPPTGHCPAPRGLERTYGRPG